MLLRRIARADGKKAEQLSKIKRNIMYNLAYQILVLIIPIITTPYISRVLGVKGVGVYSYVSSVEYYFFIFITLGLTNYGNRSIAKCADNKTERSHTFWSIYFMQFLCGICVIVIYVLFASFFSDSNYRKYFFIYTLHVLSAILDINWFYFGIEEFRFTTIRNAIVKFATFLCVLIFVRGKYALTAYFVVVAGSTFISNLLLWFRIPRYVNQYKPTIQESLIHLKPNCLLFIPIIAISVYRVMDKIMIKQLSGVVENGYYENADRIITISMTAFSAVATVMMPAISNMVASGDNDKIKKILRDMMQVIMCLSIAMTFGLIAVAREFAPLFFGIQFIETGYLMMGLAPTIVFSGWKNVLRGQYLIPYERDKAYVISLVLGAVANVICNSIFIPRYGARGAVLGTLVAEMAGFIIQTYVAGQDICISEMFKDAALFIPDGLLMGVAVHYILKVLPKNLIGVLLAIFLGAILYMLLVTATLYVFNKERLIYLLNLIKGRRKHAA